MADAIRSHDAIQRLWVEAAPPDLEVPPACFSLMEGRFVLWEPGQGRLTARYPVREAYRNPRHFMQGGFVVAALDNTLGPLSYLMGHPSVTTQLNTSFVRPVLPTHEYLEIVASIDEITANRVYSSARAISPQARLLSSVQAISQIVHPL